MKIVSDLEIISFLREQAKLRSMENDMGGILQHAADYIEKYDEVNDRKSNESTK